MKDKLPEMAEILGISLNEHQIEQFHDYYTLLLSWNQKINLTTVTEYDDVVVKHFVDSLEAGWACDFASVGRKTLLDVGSGAGFPGIPLKIAYPELSVTLLDAQQKRVSFLEEVIQTLGLTGIWAVHGRAEDYINETGDKGPVRGSFDICTSRAVSGLAVLAEYCLPYLKVGGEFLAYKSGNVGEELSSARNAVAVLGGEVEDVCMFKLPDTDIRRSIIRIRKIGATDEKYPRKAGKPEKDPL